MKHTNGKWYNKENVVWSKQGNYAQKVAVASLASSGKIKEITKNPEESISNAKRIVQCVNNFDYLLEALKEVLTMANADNYIEFHANSQMANKIKQVIKKAI